MRFAEISMYDLPDSTRLERCAQKRSGFKWAARRCSGYCINRDGELEDEPQPSSRDDTFLERCRFDSAAEAYAAWAKWAAAQADILGGK